MAQVEKQFLDIDISREYSLYENGAIEIRYSVSGPDEVVADGTICVNLREAAKVLAPDIGEVRDIQIGEEFTIYRSRRSLEIPLSVEGSEGSEDMCVVLSFGFLLKRGGVRV